MLLAVLLILLVAAVVFAGLFMGAPYLPTLKAQAEAALDLVDLKKGQTLIDLGCGDGRVLITAARRGFKAVGYEFNPVLYLVAVIRTWKYRRDIKIIWGNYWKREWPEAEAVFVFLINRYMPRLNSYLADYPYKPIKLVSFAFKIPGRKVISEKDGVYLYIYG